MDSGSRLDAPVGSFGMFSIERVNVGRIDRFPFRNRYGPPEPQWGADGPRTECRFSSHLSTVAVVILREGDAHATRGVPAASQWVVWARWRL